MTEEKSSSLGFPDFQQCYWNQGCEQMLENEIRHCSVKTAEEIEVVDVGHFVTYNTSRELPQQDVASSVIALSLVPTSYVDGDELL